MRSFLCAFFLYLHIYIADKISKLFDDATKIFSQAEVPLVVDVLPTLEELREGLIAARDDDENDVGDVIRVACQAGVLLVDKYSTFARDCDIYLIAIGASFMLN